MTVVAPEVCPSWPRCRSSCVRRRYRALDLDGRYLVVAATSDTAVNRRVFADAEARALLCNVVDVRSSAPSSSPRAPEDPITVAVSTGGASPALAQRLRDDIAELVGPSTRALAVRLRELRPVGEGAPARPTRPAATTSPALVRDELG